MDILNSVVNYFSSNVEGKFVIAMALAVLYGYLIGLEREKLGKDAGVITHIMIICGATMYTSISAFVDPASKSRIAAQIVSGIGFLGAGLILIDSENNKVRNLTTAASIWFTGAIGMALGFDLYVMATTAIIVRLLIPRLKNIS